MKRILSSNYLVMVSLLCFGWFTLTACDAETDTTPVADPATDTDDEDPKGTEDDETDDEEESGASSDTDDSDETDDSEDAETTDSEGSGDTSTGTDTGSSDSSGSSTNSGSAAFPSTGKTVSYGDLRLLARTASNALVGVTLDGSGRTNLNIAAPPSFDIPKPVTEDKQISIGAAAHWTIGESGVRSIEGELTATTYGAATPIAYPTGFDAAASVLGVTTDAIILKSADQVAIFKKDGTSMTTQLPATMDDVISMGPLKNRSGFWAVAPDKLAYYATEEGGTTYSWSDAVDIEIDIPDGATVKFVLIGVEVGENDAPEFDTYYYLLTDEDVILKNSNANGGGGSATEVGSN